MGFDKGELNFHGKTQRLFLAELMKKFCQDVFVSTKEPINEAGIECLVDEYQIESPLNGILTAFGRNSESAWLTIPVDMPGIDEEFISILISNRDQKAIATCFRDEDGEKPEPLVTIWEPRAYSLLKKFFDDGNISPREFLMNNNCKILPSPGKRFHLNINTPEEMNEFSKQNQRE